MDNKQNKRKKGGEGRNNFKKINGKFDFAKLDTIF